jgi:hypothetical protein
MRFIIGGLPRSGTTWLSAFLSTDDCLCLHDPSVDQSLEELTSWTGGICDTGIWYYTNWCRSNTDKFILIDKDVQEINKSLGKRSLPEIPPNLVTTFHGIEVKRFYFELLFTEEGMRELWEFIYPEKEFSLGRFNLFKGMHISPLYMEKINEEF